jgi:hypothetical protein
VDDVETECTFCSAVLSASSDRARKAHLQTMHGSSKTVKSTPLESDLFRHDAALSVFASILDVSDDAKTSELVEIAVESLPKPLRQQVRSCRRHILFFRDPFFSLFSDTLLCVWADRP